MLDPGTSERLAGRLASSSTSWRVAEVEVELDPWELAAAGSSGFATASYFSTPDGWEMAALGSAWRTVAPYGRDRFRALASEIGALPVDHDELCLPLGFSFAADGPRRPEWDGFAATTAVLPLVSVWRRAGGPARLVVVLPPGRRPQPLLRALETLPAAPRWGSSRAADHVLEARPSPATWLEAAAEAIDAIRAGAIDKVVLARSVIVRSDLPPEPFALVGRLRSAHPDCYVFGWQEGEAVFVGASPELLAARVGGRARTHPLAGSSRRGEGDDEDQALGQALMASPKNRSEHRLVVEDIRARLSPLLADLEIDPAPSLRRVANVQHLSTEISGGAGGAGLLEVVGAIHPTPAVGGTPRAEALAFIDKVEPIDRGWYAGGIGWTSPAGEGEVALALRCALLRGEVAQLFAGAGIVAGSHPEAELEETRLKLRPMLDLLAET